MGFIEGVGKGGFLGMFYSLVAALPFLLLLGGVSSVGDVFFMAAWIALCAMPAGALVGAAAVLTRAYRPGQLWRAQLAMLVAYVFTGQWFLGGLMDISSDEVLEMTVLSARVFLPLGVLATWILVQWLRMDMPRARSAA